MPTKFSKHFTSVWLLRKILCGTLPTTEEPPLTPFISRCLDRTHTIHAQNWDIKMTLKWLKGLSVWSNVETTSARVAWRCHHHRELTKVHTLCNFEPVLRTYTPVLQVALLKFHDYRKKIVAPQSHLSWNELGWKRLACRTRQTKPHNIHPLRNYVNLSVKAVTTLPRHEF